MRKQLDHIMFDTQYEKIEQYIVPPCRKYIKQYIAYNYNIIQFCYQDLSSAYFKKSKPGDRKGDSFKQTFDHLDAENSLTEIARCPYIKGETQ